MNQLRIKMTDELLAQVVGAVAERTGNVVGQKQINMIESRLTKRAMSLGIKSEADYISYFNANRASEIEELISILTVHHTYFFREFGQFEFLASNVLPELIKKLKAEGKNKIRVWSAACSRGQETFSLFMFIDQYLKSHSPGFSLEIVGTDIDRDSVKIASNGVYAWEEVKGIPLTYLSQYWTRGQGEIAKFAKIKEAARKACTFKQGNLMETSSFAALGKFDIIFCRNVFIYFQSSDVARIADGLAGQLNPNGFLFVGLSESLTSSPKGLKKLGPSIFGSAAAPVAEKTSRQATVAPSGPIKVFCVDDSAVILRLLKSILNPANGFEIVGTASDGVEAAKLVEQGLRFDVMTLDVHMPNMTGVEYLEQKFNSSHPPVIMLTSASRDNMDLAFKAMKLGAKDYIEKPSLSDLAARSDEIRSKLKLAHNNNSSKEKNASNLKFDKQFQGAIDVNRFDDKANVIFTDERKSSELLTVLSDRAMSGLPCIVVVNGDEAATKKVTDKVSADASVRARISKAASGKLESKVYVLSYSAFAAQSRSLLKDRTLCYAFLSNITRTQWDSFVKSAQMKILLAEDIDRMIFLSQLSQVFVSPPTSFAYTSREFFGKLDLKTAV